MTSFPTRAARAIARSRGHLRKAEESDFEPSRSFNVDKAQHALAVGVLHERTRSADAQEALAAAQILQLDPEVLGISPELETATGDKIVEWLKRYIESTMTVNGDDDD